MRIALVAASLVLVAGAAVGCGGGSDSKGSSAPKDASKSDFCGAFTNADNAKTGKEFADDLSKVGTPADISSDARKGYEVFVAAVSKSNGDDFSDLTSFEKSLSTDDQKNVAAFFTYLGTECGGLPSS